MAALIPVVSGPNYRTFSVRGVRQSTMLHLQGHTHTRRKHDTTKIVHYRNWDGRLHPLVVHPRKIQSDRKSIVQYQKWSHPRSSSIRSFPTSLSTNELLSASQNSNTHNFLPSYPNWVLFDSLASSESKEQLNRKLFRQLNNPYMIFYMLQDPLQRPQHRNKKGIF